MLPVKRPHELVQVTGRAELRQQLGRRQRAVVSDVQRDLRDHNQVFTGMFGRFGYAFTSATAGRTERVAGELVSGNYFPVARRRARPLGRMFGAEDDRVPGGHPVAVLSHALLEQPLRRRPVRSSARPMIDQRPPVHHHRRRATRASTASSSARQTQVFVPMMMKAQMTPALERALDDRALPLGPRLRAAEAGRHGRTGARGAAAVLSRPCSSCEVKERGVRERVADRCASASSRTDR